MTSTQSKTTCILIIEDDTDVREALADFLQDQGYQVAGAANGREALAVLRRIEPPCIILLDLMMPVMSGWEFRREQQQDPALAAIPVAVVTGIRNTVDRIAALNPVGYFQKPVDLSALLATVATYC